MAEEKKAILREEIGKLVGFFEQNKEQYTGAGYDEAKTRADFIDKFFKLLGWDIYNDQHYAEQYREVVREDKVEVAGKQKAPDYSFRIGGARKFFVEAKKPTVNIKQDIGPAFQLRRYAYSAKLPLSILTDFEEFAIYDTRIKPKANDRADVERIFYCTYDQYLEKFDYLYEIFSKEAILKGSFDKYAGGRGKRKGTSEVDKEFLKLIEEWRSDLARNIALNNPKIDLYNLNSAVQRIIDRIIFLRIAEDRSIEEYGTLEKLAEKENIYKKLDEYFQRSEGKFNSDLFDIESWLSNLKIDDKVLKEIIKSVYYPESPYEFAVLPVEILGNIYEQFLGKVIRLTASHEVRIEEKPEVRKAGGVYYTPQYIVDYIVKNTVGEKIKKMTPAQVEKIKILDPACGSGSFLIGAYDYLMNWHLEYYLDPKRLKASVQKGKIYHFSGEDFRLSISEKKKILRNNIFGVDIDHQATEVTKLSLLLKLMENETRESAGMLIKYKNETLLPDLKDNIKCGNSLIGSDFYEGKNMSLFDKEEMRKINVFDWDDKEKGFGDIMSDGGFDVVIGNPPYIFTRELISKDEKDYFYKKYNNTQFKLNTYILFVEKSFNLLSKRGMFGFIIPNNWLSLETTSDFRKFILSNAFDIKIVNNIDKIFQNANVDTCTLLFSRFGKDNINIYELESGNIKFITQISKNQYLKSHNFVISYRNQTANNTSDLLNKINSGGLHLDEIAEVKNGVQAYTVGEGTPKQTREMKERRIYHSLKRINNLWIKYVDGVDVKRYFIGWSKQFIKYGENLSRPRRADLFKDERILVRQIPSRPPYSILACYVKENLVNDNNSMIVKIRKDIKLDCKYIISLLNSRLISFWFLNTFGKLQRKIFPQFKVNELSIFPIVKIDLDKKEDRVKYDRVINLVNQMFEVQKKFHSAKTEADKNVYQQKIDILDKQIDKIVYDLYGLSDAEIKIIEDSFTK